MPSITQACVPVDILASMSLKSRLQSLCTPPDKVLKDFDILAVELILTIEDGVCYRTIAPHNILIKTPDLESMVKPWYELHQSGLFKADLRTLASTLKSLEWHDDNPLEEAVEKMHRKSARRRSQYSVLLAEDYGAVRRQNHLAFENIFMSAQEDDLLDLQQFVDGQSMVLTAAGLSHHERLSAAKKGEKIAALFGPMRHPRARGIIRPDLRFETL